MAKLPDVTIDLEKPDEKAAVQPARCESDSDSDNLEVYSDSEVSQPAHIAEWWRWLFQCWILENWKKMFVTSCVFAVWLDPLFLYIPMIKQDMTCLSLDHNLKIIALTLRSFTDIFYLVDIVIQIYTSEQYSMRSLKNKFHNSSKYKFLCKTFLPTVAKTIWRSYILIDILAVLPFPQVLILTFFSKMRASRSFDLRKFTMNFFVLMQYIPRILRFYFLCKDPAKKSIVDAWGDTPIWVKCVLNFFLYILFSHVLGALWYFFSIERMTSCWQRACRTKNNCNFSNFGCHGDPISRNLAFLNDLCPTSQPNTTLFDFGLFLTLLQSDVPGSTNFLKKFFNCFFWGLRNLSSLGSNLEPSTNTGENLFGVLISIIGLLLFIYLIGNLQTYLSLDTTRIHEHRHKMKMKRKLEEKDRELQIWLPKNGIPKKSQKDIKLKIMEKFEEKLEEKLDVDLDNIFSLLPDDLEKKIKRRMPLTKFKKVRALENMEEQVLREICGRLTPMRYAKNKVIIRENEPLKMMLFIVEGQVDVKMKDGSVLQKRARQLCGEHLLAWPFSTSFFPHTLPISNQSATTIGDVEALILKESDMKSVASTYRAHFIKNYWKLKDIFENQVSSHPANLHIPGIQDRVFRRFKRRLNDGHFVTTTLDVGAAELGTTQKMFTPQELRKATKNYHVGAKIGEGSYGIVYKGILPTKEVVAIKKSKSDAPEQTERCVNEAVVLSKVMRHTNVVKLLGGCLETKMPIMVYEFIKGGTLYDQIQMINNQPHLSLESRLKIAVGVARALEYLHHDILIIHCDVSTRNIFLDENYMVKLSDFGSSKLVHEDEAEVEVEYEDTVVKNSLPMTAEYLDPEYLHSKILTKKSDVYSFGVVLAELLTGRKALFTKTPEAEGKQQLLATFFVSSVEEDRLNDIVDGEIVKEKEKGSVNECVEKVSGVAMKCLKPKGEERPSMTQVVSELESIRSEFESIRSPKYYRFSFDSSGCEPFFASQLGKGVHTPQKPWDVVRRATMKTKLKKNENTNKMSFSG